MPDFCSKMTGAPFRWASNDLRNAPPDFHGPHHLRLRCSSASSQTETTVVACTLLEHFVEPVKQATLRLSAVELLVVCRRPWPCAASCPVLAEQQPRLLSCVRGARGTAPAHCPRRGRRLRRLPRPRGPPRCSAPHTQATGRRGTSGVPGYVKTPRGPDRRGGLAATGCVPRGCGLRGRGTSMHRRGSGACTPGRCTGWAAWSGSCRHDAWARAGCQRGDQV